jgi:SAM-dependent methyltransferase
VHGDQVLVDKAWCDGERRGHFLLASGDRFQKPPSPLAMRWLNVVCMWTVILLMPVPSRSATVTTVTEPAFLHSTRVSYDRIAEDYAQKYQAELPGVPFERAMLSVFAQLVLDAGGGMVADVGCGPGHLTEYLNRLGLNVFGVDLSPGMLAVARRAYPALRFDEGSMTGLSLADGALAGIVAFYSTIHIPTEGLGEVFGEFHRVLAPDGLVLLAFQRGDEPGHRSEAFGHEVSLDYYLRQPEAVAGLLAEAGFEVRAQLTREPTPPDEKAPRAFLFARKADVAG